jgi:hypothetical protein
MVGLGASWMVAVNNGSSHDPQANECICYWNKLGMMHVSILQPLRTGSRDRSPLSY